MNWCLVSREYPPFTGGGIGTYAKAMASLLARRGERVVVVTTGPGKMKVEKEDGVVVVRLPLVEGDDWSRPHPAIRTAMTEAAWRAFVPHAVFSMGVADVLPGLILEYGIDVVEFPDTGAAGWFTLNTRRTTGAYDGVRMLTVVHSPSAWVERVNRRCQPGRAMHELCRMEHEQAQWSDAVVSPSHFMADWVRTNWNITPAVIRNPIPIAEDSETGPIEDGVLYVGRLEYRKGIDTLLHAWAKVKTDQRLHLVGLDVPDERVGVRIGESLLGQIPREASLRVVEHGVLGSSEVGSLQSSVSVVVVPSPEDNLPYTCVEAMASGRVVIASRVGGASELIEDGVSGLLFDSGQVDSLAQVLTRALAMSDAEIRDMGEAARERVQSMCDPATVLDDRLRHALTAEHWREIHGEMSLVTLNAGSMIDPGIERLRRAVMQTDAAFAHGWPKSNGRIIAHATPSVGGYLAGPREVGPVVVQRSWLEREPMCSALPAIEGEIGSVRDVWKLLSLILLNGGRGAVVPNAVCKVAEPEGPGVEVDAGSLVDESVLLGEPGVLVGRAVRLGSAFEGPMPTMTSRVMGKAKRLLGGA